MKLFKSSLLLFIILLATSCVDNNEYFNSEPKFNIDLFNQNIQNTLNTNFVGYAYLINQNGQAKHSNTFGNWNQNQNSIIPANLNTPIYLASVNKLIMAVAILKAMDIHGTGAADMLNKPIEPYLPQSWNRHPNMNLLTFRDVLTHRTGYTINSAEDNNNDYDSNYQDLAQMFTDASASTNSQYYYSNCNYGLLRYLLAGIIGTNIGLPSQENDVVTQDTYISFLNNEIFSKIGMKPARTNPSNVRYYNVNDNNFVRGWNIGTRSENLGAGGLYMSVTDLARFLAYLKHTNYVLEENSKTLLFLNFAGLSDLGDPIINPTQGDHGTYFTKGGSLINNTNTSLGQGTRNIVMLFPNNVEIAILSNSRGGFFESNSLRIAVANAYDNAWE